MKLQFFKCEHCGNIAVKLFDEGQRCSAAARR